MPNLIDLLFGNDSRPIRRNAQLRITVDSDGNRTIQLEDGQSVALAPDGSLDTIRIAPDSFYHCGCSKRVAIGGQCAEPGCRRVSCRNCFGRCVTCHKPVCLEHSTYLENEQSVSEKMCRWCADLTKRRRRGRSIARLLLHPFRGSRK